MAETSYNGQQYRLRAGSPMPIQTAGTFVLHTFMAEVSNFTVYACTSTLPGSSSFRGQGGDYISANFSRLNTKGGEVFSGRVVYAPTFVDEDEIS